MADTIYTAGVLRLIDQASATPDIRSLLIDNANPYTADPDHASIADVVAGAVTELSTDNYARHQHASEDFTADDTNDRVELDLDDAVFTDLGPATSGPVIQGILVYLHVDGTDANDVPLCWQEDATGLPLQTNGATVTFAINTEGLLHISQAA